MTQRISFQDWLPWIAAAAGGILAFLGYAGFDQFYLEWICLVPILWAIRNQSPLRAFFIGWVAGIIGHGGGFYWIIYMFEQFAGLSWPPALLGLLLLAAANGIVFAVWAGLTRLITGKTGWSVIWVAPVIWTALEKFWPEIFPNYLGASQYKLTAITQIADVTGILGVTFLLVYGNALIYTIIERRLNRQSFDWRPAAVFITVIALVLVYGTVRIHGVEQDIAAADHLTVGLVQANRGMQEKHLYRNQVLQEHQEMSRKMTFSHPVDLIVWPENIQASAITSRTGQLPPGLLGDFGAPVLFGAILKIDTGRETRFYNSAVLADSREQMIGTYDKMVLVPMGEYIPFGDTFPILYSWSPYSGRLWPGENLEPLMLGSHAISINICYEDIFPGQIRMLMKGGKDHLIPEVMFNLTDDSWYGDTIEPMEHLALASFRSIEHRRTLVRSTTTGISAIIDPLGRLNLRTGQWTRETLVGRIPMMKGRTIYALTGDWLGWLCLVLLLTGIGRVYQFSRRLRQDNPMTGPKEKNSIKKQKATEMLSSKTGIPLSDVAASK